MGFGGFGASALGVSVSVLQGLGVQGFGVWEF